MIEKLHYVKGKMKLSLYMKTSALDGDISFTLRLP
jgi:hypothetical protein